MRKSVSSITGIQNIRMDGHLIRQPFPSPVIEQLDPFLLLHHWGPETIPAGGPGVHVAPHPHRGFMPITILLQGEVAHQDSRENRAIARTGDVQWFNAGRGIIHSEKSPEHFLKQGGTVELLQLWINLPSQKKMMQPAYQLIQDQNIPRVALGKAASMRLISGEMMGKKGPAIPHSPLILADISIPKNHDTTLQLPEKFDTSMYIIHGHAGFQETWYSDDHHLIRFSEAGSEVHIHALTDCRLLLMGGIKLNEPLAWQGPFVMNTQTELLEAMRDYQMGKMGILIEEPM